VLFFAGSFGEDVVNPADPHRVSVLAGYTQAIFMLRQRGYQAEYVGGHWADLQAGNKESRLLGLLAMGHGYCGGSGPGTSVFCGLRTLDSGKHIFYRVSSDPEYDDWVRLRGESPRIFKLLSVCHCVDKLFATHTDTIVRWLADSIGQSVAKVRFCHVDPTSGHADSPDYNKLLWDFVDAFP
jgi:hypothetical protein